TDADAHALRGADRTTGRNREDAQGRCGTRTRGGAAVAGAIARSRRTKKACQISGQRDIAHTQRKEKFQSGSIRGPISCGWWVQVPDREREARSPFRIPGLQLWGRSE